MARKPPSSKTAGTVPAASRSKAISPSPPPAFSGLRGNREDEAEDAANDAAASWRSAEQDEEAGATQSDLARSALVERIWARLNQYTDLELADISIQMERDTVRVTGIVATDAARRRIADCVGACAGVRVIRNGIRLTS